MNLKQITNNNLGNVGSWTLLPPIMTHMPFYQLMIWMFCQHYKLIY